jgi:hypothetical protein
MGLGVARRRKQQQLKKMFADPQYTARWAVHQQQQQQNRVYPNVTMGRFFGHINRFNK